MNVGDLLNHTRMKLTSMGLSGLVDKVLISYADDAYNKFVGELEGVSDEEEIEVIAGATEVELPEYVLKIKSAQLSDGSFINVYNRSDTMVNDFNRQFGKEGEITSILIGTKPNAFKVAGSPVEDTTITLDVDRLPRKALAGKSDSLSDVSVKWQLELMDMIVARVLMNSPDADLRAQAPGFESRFYKAARDARSEKSRSSSKVVRMVEYGGL